MPSPALGLDLRDPFLDLVQLLDKQRKDLAARLRN